MSFVVGLILACDGVLMGCSSGGPGAVGEDGVSKVGSAGEASNIGFGWGEDVDGVEESIKKDAKLS